MTATRASTTDTAKEPAPASSAQPFSQALRASTKQVHDRAHHSSYMDALLDGSLTLAGYTRLAAQYFFIYATLEEAGATMATDPVGAPFDVD